jgi:cation transport regulator ChaB
MPYQTNADLPAAVQKLSAQEQSAWREAFNSAAKDGEDEMSSMKIAWAAVKKMAAMSDFENQWIEVFRTGDYGAKGTYGPAHLDAMVANLSAWKPPAVLGHPESDSPAMGWAEQLKREGNVLLARFEKVHPALQSLVAEGRYPNRSIAIYTDPQGKGPAVRHIGFLGGAPPEVKGLAPIRFSDGDFVAIEFNEEESMKPEEMKNAVRDFFAELFGGDGKTKSFSEERAQQMVDKAVELTSATFKEELGKRDTQIATLTTQLGDRAKAEREGSVTALAEGAVAKLKAAGKWIPAYAEMGVPEIFTELAKSEAKVSFGEGDKKTEKKLLAVFADFFDGLPKIVPAGEIAKGASSARKGGKVLQFNEAKGVELDLSSVAFSEAAQKRADEKKIPFGEALRQLREEGFVPMEGGAAANAV